MPSDHRRPCLCLCLFYLFHFDFLFFFSVHGHYNFMDKTFFFYLFHFIYIHVTYCTYLTKTWMTRFCFFFLLPLWCSFAFHHNRYSLTNGIRKFLVSFSFEVFFCSFLFVFWMLQMRFLCQYFVQMRVYPNFTLMRRVGKKIKDEKKRMQSSMESVSTQRYAYFDHKSVKLWLNYCWIVDTPPTRWSHIVKTIS